MKKKIGQTILRQKKQLLKYWKAEEKRSFHGWDFSSIEKYREHEFLPWDYQKMVRKLIDPKETVLDMGTADGEFLLTLNPIPGRTYATESYKPNYQRYREHLKREGIDLSYLKKDDQLPYSDSFFDTVLNRHDWYDVNQISRVLKPGGVFITQQVGERNNRNLAQSLLNKEPDKPESEFTLNGEVKKIESAGFKIIAANEVFPKCKYKDVGAFVYFAKIIEWEFPGFSVEKHQDKLFELQREIFENGYFESEEHRFFIKAIKAN